MIESSNYNDGQALPGKPWLLEIVGSGVLLLLSVLSNGIIQLAYAQPSEEQGRVIEESPTFTPLDTAPFAPVTVSITTKDSGGVIVDGPTNAPAYTIRKIGTSQIADNSITADKITDGAILPDTIQQLSPVSAAGGGMHGEATATCPSSHPILTGGGFTVQSGAENFMRASDSFEFQNNAWTVIMFNSGTQAQVFTFRAVAMCMAPMP